MPKKSGKSRRHIPQRTCVGCRQTGSKRELIRIVRTPDGIQIEHNERLHGRGAYLHPTAACWEKGLKSSLPQALRTEISEQDMLALREHVRSLSGDQP
jgi:predicted RNA-binding protein YlxR (DUF448 family)